MIKTVIIEDEKPASRKLERMLSNFPEIEIVAKIESVEEGVAWFSENVDLRKNSAIAETADCRFR